MPAAWYTDFDGNLLTIGGCAGHRHRRRRRGRWWHDPAGPTGVSAVADQTFDTFLARVIGFTQFTAQRDATARAGCLTGTCDADAGCIILPITVPVTVLGCDGQNKPGTARPMPTATRSCGLRRATRR